MQEYACEAMRLYTLYEKKSEHTHSLTRARDTVNSHAMHTHSRERCKPGQYAGWQLLQLVALKRKALHLGHALEGIGRHQRDTPIVKIQCAISIMSFLI